MVFKDLAIGGLSGVVSRTLTAPLELNKIQRQNYFIPNSTIRAVIQKEGLRYLWKGNGINCLRIVPQHAISFAICRNVKERTNRMGKIFNNLMAGTIGGVVAMTSIYPFETVRSRLTLQTNKSHYKGISDAFFQIIKKEGIRGLYKGLVISLYGFGAYSGLNFGFYHYYKEKTQEIEINNNIKKLLCGGFTGVSSVTLTYPSDLIRRRLQIQGFDSSVPKYDGLFDCVRKVVKHGGISGLYTGLGATYIKLFPTVAIQFWCLDTLKEYSILNTSTIKM